MKMFNFFKRKQKNNYPKTYELSYWEAICRGEKYTYKVKANSKEEAFKKLVEFFFGENDIQPVKQEESSIHYPYYDQLGYDGMPRWFAKRISGSWSDQDDKELKKYAIQHNIKLKNNY